MLPSLNHPQIQPPPTGGVGVVACGRRRLLGLVGAVLMGVWAGQAGAGEVALPEPQIKALFLFNFTKYVEWPEPAFGGPTAPLIIGIVGAPAVAEPLEKLAAGKSLNGHPIVIRRLEPADQTAPCHILFLGDLPSQQLPEWLQVRRGQPVLVVGEDAKFTELGGIVNFGQRDHKIRLEINTNTAAASGLKLSSKLLAVADLVNHPL